MARATLLPIWPQIGAIKSMINLDMVGRLREDRVTVFGIRSSPPFDAIVGAGAKQLGITNPTSLTASAPAITCHSTTNRFPCCISLPAATRTTIAREILGTNLTTPAWRALATSYSARPWRLRHCRNPRPSPAYRGDRHQLRAASGGLAAFIWESFPNTATVSMACCSQASRLAAQPRRQVYLKVI